MNTNNQYRQKINCTIGRLVPIKYIVIHYIGATGSAEANAKYFSAAYRGASAHDFIGWEGDIWNSVSYANSAWHCGTKKGYKHPTCRNGNSIGIEMACFKDKNGRWDIKQKTLDVCAEHVADLMHQYAIPIDNVIRHYDVTGKLCPEPLTPSGKYGEEGWLKLKDDIRKMYIKKYPPRPQFETGKTYTTTKSAFLRNIALEKVPVSTKLSNTLKKRCINSGGYWQFKAGGAFTLSETMEDSKRNLWGKIRSGHWLPLYYNNTIRAEVKK